MALHLEDRNNPTAWAQLLDKALPALDHVFENMPLREDKNNSINPNWTLGGGTAIALRIGHRLSDDIDIFIHGASLKKFTPTFNPAAKLISNVFRYPGHYIKFELEKGEIDFLTPPLQTDPGYSREIFKGRPIALETLSEVIVKKVRYRSSNFTPRDIFDLAATGERLPTLPITLMHECDDLLPELKGIVDIRIANGLDLSKNVRPMPAFNHLLQAAPETALSLIATSIDLSRLNRALVNASIVKPSDTPGKIYFDWNPKNEKHDRTILKVFDDHPELAKIVLENELERRSPENYARYTAMKAQSDNCKAVVAKAKTNKVVKKRDGIGD